MRVRITSVYSQTKLMELWVLRAEARDPEDRENREDIQIAYIFRRAVSKPPLTKLQSVLGQGLQSCDHLISKVAN